MQLLTKFLILMIGTALGLSCVETRVANSSPAPQRLELSSPVLAKEMADSLQSMLLGSGSQENVRAISYSGYRSGQGPGLKDPSYEEVKEDLQIISKRWNIIRVYGAGSHTDMILKVIHQENLKLKVMLGAWLEAEASNPACSWGGKFTEAELQTNRSKNRQEIDRAIALAQAFPETITALSIGNEVLVDWTDHLVPAAALIAHVKRVKALVKTPLTVADNYVPWQRGQDELVQLLSFITLHSYPIWENQPIEKALSFAEQNFRAVQQRYPTKPIVIGETGWTTATNAVQIPASFANEAYQQEYFRQISQWSETHRTPVFFFEAFDEDWKGGPSPVEPEKHWGLFTADRRPKAVMREYYPELAL